MTTGPLTARILAENASIATSIALRKAAFLDEVATVAESLGRDDEAGFSDVIRALVEAGFPATRIARHTSVDPSTVTMWSKGRSLPPPVGRPVIARHLAGRARQRAIDARRDIAAAALPVAA